MTLIDGGEALIDLTSKFIRTRVLPIDDEFDGDITVCSHRRFKPASHLRVHQNAADGSPLFMQ